MTNTMRQGFEALKKRVQSMLRDHRDEIRNRQDTPPPFPGGYGATLEHDGPDYFTCHRGDARGCHRVRFYLENEQLLRVKHCYEEHSRTTEYTSISCDGTVLHDPNGKRAKLEEVLRDFLTAELI